MFSRKGFSTGPSCSPQRAPAHPRVSLVNGWRIFFFLCLFVQSPLIPHPVIAEETRGPMLATAWCLLCVDPTGTLCLVQNQKHPTAGVVGLRLGFGVQFIDSISPTSKAKSFQLASGYGHSTECIRACLFRNELVLGKTITSARAPSWALLL